MATWIGMTIAPAVSDRCRSLEGRPLGMSCSVLLPESARLRLLALGSSFVTALAEQRQPLNGLMSFASRARWPAGSRTRWPAGQWLQPNLTCGSASPRER
jgi:hypothetical protein